MTLCQYEQLIIPIIAEGNSVKYYALNGELFKTLQETHLSIFILKY